MMFNRWISLVLTVILLAGCAGKAEHYAAFDSLRWQADGKLGAKYPRCDPYRGCKDEAVNAGYLWTHNETSDRLQLFDPTGQERLALVYRGDRVTIHEGGNVDEIDIDQLADRLGIALPVAQLDDWITQQRTESEWDSGGWHVRVNDWQGHFYRSLTLTQGEYRVKLITYNIKPM